jgi:hypothetical protein
MVLRSKVQVYVLRSEPYLANVPENDEHDRPLNSLVMWPEISYVWNVNSK